MTIVTRETLPPEAATRRSLVSVRGLRVRYRGAAGFLLEDAPAEELIGTIHRVHAGERLVQPDVAARLLTELGGRGEGAASAALTEREAAILRLLAAGDSNRAIADKLYLAEGTVKNYVSALLEKPGASNRTQAVNITRERRLI